MNFVPKSRENTERQGALDPSPGLHLAERFAIAGAALLIAHSLLLLLVSNDGQLKTNLVLQTAALASFAWFTWRASGTFLSAPLLFNTSIYLWHSTFLVGYYFDLAEIFEFPGNAFSYGFQFIYKATAYVSLCLGCSLAGMLWGYRHERIHQQENAEPAALSALYRSLGPATKRAAWGLLAAMLLIFILFFVEAGGKMGQMEYLDLYATTSPSLSFVLFVRSEFLWVFVIVLLIGCYRNNRVVRTALAGFFIVISAFLALLGTRTFPFVCLGALLLAWDCFVRRIRLWIIFAFVLGLSAASFVIATTRDAGLGANVFNFSNSGRDRLDLLESFYEEGKTIKVVLRTFDFTQRTGLVYGRTLADSALSVIPLPFLKVVGYEPQDPLGEWIVHQSPDLEAFTGLGSSLPAELFYNFGMISCLLFLGIGWMISRAYFRYIFMGDMFTAVQVMTVAAMFLVVMRDDTESYFRLLVYASLIVSFLRWKKETYLLRVIEQTHDEPRRPRLGSPYPPSNGAPQEGLS